MEETNPSPLASPRMELRTAPPEEHALLDALPDELFVRALEIQRRLKNYEDTFNKLVKEYPILASVDLPTFKRQCKNCFPYLTLTPSQYISPSPDSNSSSLAITFNRSISFTSPSNQYFYSSLTENERPRQGRWSPDEEELFITVLTNLSSHESFNDPEYHTAQWGFISNFIEGRTGKQCYDKYKSLLDKGKIQDILSLVPKPKITPFTQHSTPALTPEAQKKLLDFIFDQNRYCEPVTTKVIMLKARELYNDPTHIATKAALNYFFDHNLDPYEGDGYSEEFQQFYSDLLPRAYEDLHALRNDYHVKEFSACQAWINRFMDRNRLVIRKAHPKKRGAIKEEFVENYLSELAEAIENYGPDKILNMDETQIKLDNSTNYTITQKGATDVIVHTNDSDEKAGTSYIGTISLNPSIRYPLVLVAKGKTDRCEAKYGTQPNVVKIHHESGWSHTDVMIKYLDIIVKYCKPPFALVLDVYSTHREKAFIEHAKTLGIQLIFVPACGTGMYQPLDRKIFGIVKKKLQAMDNAQPIVVAHHKEKYEIVNTRVSKIWKEIKDEAIKSAWEIPGLNLFQSDLTESSESDDEYPPHD